MRSPVSTKPPSMTITTSWPVSASVNWQVRASPVLAFPHPEEVNVSFMRLSAVVLSPMGEIPAASTDSAAVARGAQYATSARVEIRSSDTSGRILSTIHCANSGRATDVSGGRRTHGLRKRIGLRAEYPHPMRQMSALDQRGLDDAERLGAS